MCGPHPARRQTLTATLLAERSPRELRLVKKVLPPPRSVGVE
jgi:tRNA(Ile)-lysidine synthase